MNKNRLPIGMDDFEEIITKEYYYVDKTLLIKELVDKMGKVNLFTRPRRFGKTLNLSMLKYYFEKPIDQKSRKYLFDGLKIMDAGTKYTSLQGQYPVIFLTLKSAKQGSWELSYKSLIEELANEFERHDYVLNCEDILEEDKEKYRAVRGRRGEAIDYAKALFFLSKCLYLYHRKRVVILIDEYDVPLENAYYSGFYYEMIRFIRYLFE
ncbi:MAG: AAA family ATPase, partial [Lachnospiraceae bacterium]|nr:AAA family ATPase [Lachnospiraceae bacterium]